MSNAITKATIHQRGERAQERETSVNNLHSQNHSENVIIIIEMASCKMSIEITQQKNVNEQARDSLEIGKCFRFKTDNIEISE